MTATYTHVGLTARRDGLSVEQYAALSIVLVDLRDRCGAQVLHHGDSVGGDAQGAELARWFGYRIIGHPPTEHPEDGDGHRANFDSDEHRPPVPPRVRDCALVDEVDVLLGFPPTDSWTVDSGTWYCIEYATLWRRTARLVIGPTGRVLDSVDIGGLWENVA